MNKFRSVLFLLATALSPACVYMISHNQDLAASSAVKFLNVAFIDQNFLEASKKLQANQSAESLKLIEDFAKGLHPNGWPTSIKAIEYEPIPSQKAMRIFLIGDNNEGEKFYYIVVMLGTTDEGYVPSEIYRNPDPFPHSSARMPLPIVRSN